MTLQMGPSEVVGVERARIEVHHNGLRHGVRVRETTRCGWG